MAGTNPAVVAVFARALTTFSQLARQMLEFFDERSSPAGAFRWFVGLRTRPTWWVLLACLLRNGTGPRLQSRPRETLRPALSTQVQSTRSGAASMVCRGRSAP